ncbi:MAG: ATP-binding protein [Chloroflexi bacterium]|nr:ATP-binding protein [Chloroflexota bacterium]
MALRNLPIRYQIILPFSFLIVLLASSLVVIVLYGIFAAEDKRMIADLEEAMKTTSSMFDQHETSQQLAQSEALADSAPVITAVERKDTTALEHLLRPAKDRLDLDAIYVFGSDQEPLTDLSSPYLKEVREGGKRVIWGALAGSPTAGVSQTPVGPMIIAGSPITGTSGPTAALLTGILVDDKYLEQIKSVVGADLSLYVGDQLAASTLGQDGRIALEKATRDSILHSESTGLTFVSRRISVPTNSYLVGDLPVEIDGDSLGTVAVADSITKMVAARAETMWAAVAVSVAGVLAAMATGYFIARRITKPLEHLVTATGKVSRGDLAQEIEVTSRDEVGQLANSIHTMIAEIRVIDQMKSDFLATVSHELRTPLTLIKGSVELLLDSQAGDTNSSQRKLIENINRYSDRLGSHVMDLLDMAQLETGRLSLDVQKTDLGKVVLEAAREMSVVISQKKQQLQTHVPDNLPEFLVDRRRLHQILSNLLTNASKYTPESGRISMSVSLEETAVIVDVSDTGPGIPESELDKVFERFYRTESGKQASGTGLGLSIAKSLVELHGGKMWAESVVGSGSNFCFSLPREVVWHE